jgi:hypothetical protein
MPHCPMGNADAAELLRTHVLGFNALNRCDDPAPVTARVTIPTGARSTQRSRTR